MPILIEQPGIHDLPHHGAGDTATGLAVLDHYRNHDLRVLGRGETDEQGVVAVTLEGFLAVVTLALLDRHHLCGAALAGDAVLSALRGCSCNAACIVHDHLHAVIDLLPVTRVLEQDVGHGMFINRSDTVHGLGQVRAIPDTLVGDQRGGLGELQRRNLHVALADAEDHGFTGKPGLTARGTLPGLGRHQAGRLFVHVQRHFLTEAEHRHVVMQAVDAQLVGQIVKVSVVGTHDRCVHVHPAVAAVVPVAVFVIVVRQLVVTGIEDASLGRNHAGIQTGDCHFRLDCRTGRIEAPEDTVEQRSVDGIMQRRVFLEADTCDEQVRVEAGFADHGQHFAGGRI
ncbi:hypothetical protein D3C73_1023050 [compost metagenome]